MPATLLITAAIPAADPNFPRRELYVFDAEGPAAAFNGPVDPGASVIVAGAIGAGKMVLAQLVGIDAAEGRQVLGELSGPAVDGGHLTGPHFALGFGAADLIAAADAVSTSTPPPQIIEEVVPLPPNPSPEAAPAPIEPTVVGTASTTQASTEPAQPTLPPSEPTSAAEPPATIPSPPESAAASAPTLPPPAAA